MAGKLYTLTDLAKETGYSIPWIWNLIYVFKRVPEPEIQVGKRMLYNEQAFKQAVKKIPKEKGIRPKTYKKRIKGEENGN